MHTQINDVAALKAAGIEPRAVGWALVKVFAELMLIQGYVHGDPHPGNAMVRGLSQEGAAGKKGGVAGSQSRESDSGYVSAAWG